MVLIKVADISNEARPMEVAEPWLDRLLQEFFAQSAAEKLEGLPVTPFMVSWNINWHFPGLNFTNYWKKLKYDLISTWLTQAWEKNAMKIAMNEIYNLQ